MGGTSIQEDCRATLARLALAAGRFNFGTGPRRSTLWAADGMAGGAGRGPCRHLGDRGGLAALAFAAGLAALAAGAALAEPLPRGPGGLRLVSSAFTVRAGGPALRPQRGQPADPLRPR